ncbi:aldehyde dehydrogenase family protein [Escherichia coli]
MIAQANDTEFGLAAYFYARDLSRVFRVGEALEYGIVGINTGIISNEVAPFGGIKASGLVARFEVLHRRLLRNQIYVHRSLTGERE